MTSTLPAEFHLNALNKAVDAVRAHINTYVTHHRLRQLEAESGMSYDWLRSMHQGRIPNPTIKSLQNILGHMRRHRPSGAAGVCLRAVRSRPKTGSCPAGGRIGIARIELRRFLQNEKS